MPALKQIKWHREGDCFRCTSHKTDKVGYVRIMRDKKLFSIARRILEKRHGCMIGLVARHTCDNRWCINPSHLIPGTSLDNVRDMISRGRMNQDVLLKSGELNVSSKLSESSVRAIRKSSKSQTLIARKYKVDQSLVSLIRARKIWRHI